MTTYFEVLPVVVIDDGQDDVHVDKEADHQEHHKEDHIVGREVKSWHPEENYSKASIMCSKIMTKQTTG